MAQKTIPNLPVAVFLSPSAQLEVVQDGASYRASASQIANLTIINNINRFTEAPVPPVLPVPIAGDRWFNTDTGVLYTFITDASGGQWVELNAGGSTPGNTFTEAATPPTNPPPVAGDRWFNTDTGILYTFITDASGGQWVELNAGGGTSGNIFTESAIPPSSPPPMAGDRWFNTDSGIQYTYITDSGGGQWVELNAGGGAGTTFTEAPTPPVSPAPVPGDRWLNINTGVEYTFTTDAGGGQWVELSNSTAPAGTAFTASATPPTSPPPTQGDRWVNTSTNTLYTYYAGNWVAF